VSYTIPEAGKSRIFAPELYSNRALFDNGTPVFGEAADGRKWCLQQFV
jgi:hypothetical protein